MTNLERLILAAIAHNTADLLKPRQWPDWRLRSQWRETAVVRLAIADIEARFGVHVDLARWTKQEGPAARQAGRRALQQLEAAGLIVRHAPAGECLTHAKLTETGADLTTTL